MINKLLNMFDRYNIKRATDLVKKGVLHPSEDLVYDVVTIILPEYRHVKTPLQVEEFLRCLKLMNLQPVAGPRGNFNFCLDSVAYSRRQEKQASSIAFKTYWPSFDSLDDAQKRWYFYWRKEVLSCNYIETEANYIFVFVYELLNYTFNDNAAFNLSMLDRLYRNYHDKHSALAHFLPQWIGDFCYELGDYELEEKWTDKVPNYQNLDYENLKRLENKLETISITFWKQFIKSNKTKFFKIHRNLIYKVFKASVSMLETNYQVQAKSLIDEWMPKNEKLGFRRQLFLNALIGRKTQSKVEDSRRPTLKMGEELTALYRLAENIARIRVGEKRQLSVDEALFPLGFKNALVELFLGLGSAIPNPPKPPEPVVETIPVIEFDFDRIDILDKESKELLEIFALRYEEEEEISDQDKVQLPNSSKQLSLDEDVESFSATLNDLERDFISGFKGLARATPEGRQTLKAHGIMMGVFLSKLNEKSLEYLGDNLIEQEGDFLRFNEDFEQVYIRLAKED